MKPTSSAYSAPRLLKWVDRFQDVPVLVVGDLMIDRSYRGPADRISPEAPVPVVHVQHESFAPGGAGNVVNNLSVLGARPTLVSVCGDDREGEEIRRDLSSRHVDVSAVFIDAGRPTITKTRVFVGHQQVARFDFEKRGEMPADILSDLLISLRRLIPRHKAVIISDYGKGVVTPSVIRTCLRAARSARIPVIVDPKIEHFRQYKGVDCITPNTKEAVEGMRAFHPKSENEVVTLGERIVKALRCRTLLMTRGEKGMTLFDGRSKPVTIPAVAQEVYDVTGAGDTVVATFSLARGVGAPFADAAWIANLAASVVVSKVGTAVVSCDELIARVRKKR